MGGLQSLISQISSLGSVCNSFNNEMRNTITIDKHIIEEEKCNNLNRTASSDIGELYSIIHAIERRREEERRRREEEERQREAARASSYRFRY